VSVYIRRPAMSREQIHFTRIARQQSVDYHKTTNKNLPSSPLHPTRHFVQQFEMSFTTSVLITGSKSGIGKGLLAAYASRPNTLAIAAIRDGPDSGAAKALTSLPVGPGSKIVVAKYDASSRTAATELVKFIKATHHVSSLDVVIANAGILKHFGPAKEASAETIAEHFEINTLAPILLYQATQELLNASSQTPKFFFISSSIGSNGLQDHYPLPVLAYGLSKTALNWAASRIHREEDRIVVVPMQPGWVQTGMPHAH
jgi:norsolorinic acid ketoreductase